ncbi:MAG: cytochrome c biogenesis protein CcdA [Methylacidiphilales bacterium]|nr:cytochrome c biogenesis protein CcdA [Candidatus Methylacidiphilales bacterium]
MIFSIFVAFLLGSRHAIESDHVATVCGLTAMKQGIISKTTAIKTFALWTFGHSVSIFLGAIILISFSVTVIHKIGHWLNAIVGIAMIFLGIRIMYLVTTYKKNLYRSTTSKQDNHAPSSFSMGVIHGLAGSGPVLLLFLSNSTSTSFAFVHLFVFTLGVLLTMLVVALIFSYFYHEVSRKKAQVLVAFQCLTGMINFILGGLMLVPDIIL